MSHIGAGELTQKGDYPKRTALGNLGVQSFLEDVTAGRAVGLDNVGSGIRAQTMAAKWKMKKDGTEDAGKGFADALYASFPQLGTDKKKIGDLDKTGIAELKKHWDTGGTSFTKADQLSKIEAAHTEAHNAAVDVFNQKANKLFSAEASAPQGKWWKDNEAPLQTAFKDLQSEDGLRVDNAKRDFSNLEGQYVKRKFSRHGIKND